MTNWEGENRYALYDKFWIGSSMDLYRLHVESHSGSAGEMLFRFFEDFFFKIVYNFYSYCYFYFILEDSFLYHHKKQFSTYDSDHDDNWGESNGNCAEVYGGGW